MTFVYSKKPTNEEQAKLKHKANKSKNNVKMIQNIKACVYTKTASHLFALQWHTQVMDLRNGFEIRLCKSGSFHHAAWKRIKADSNCCSTKPFLDKLSGFCSVANPLRCISTFYFTYNQIKPPNIHIMERKEWGQHGTNIWKIRARAMNNGPQKEKE